MQEADRLRLAAPSRPMLVEVSFPCPTETGNAWEHFMELSIILSASRPPRT